MREPTRAPCRYPADRPVPVAAAVLVAALLLTSCDGGPQGPRAVDYYDEYTSKSDEGKRLEKDGKRMQAILAYRDAKKALEDLRLAHPESDYFDQAELSYLVDLVKKLEDEERRGVEAIAERDKPPPPPPEPELSGELYWSIRKSIEAKIGDKTNTEPPFDRAKHIEPHVIDGMQSLRVRILADDEFIEGLAVAKCKRALKEVMKVLQTHKEDLTIYPQIIVAGSKLVPDAEGLATDALLVEYRFTQEDFRAVDVAKLDDEEFDLRDVATKTIEP